MPEARPAGPAWIEVPLVTAAVAGAVHFAFQAAHAATPVFWLVSGVPTMVLAAYACARLARDGELGELLRPAWGDFTRGFLGAVGLFAAAVAFARLATPAGSPRESWLVRVYLQIGDPRDLEIHRFEVGFSILVLAAAEELVWRGLVTRALEERLGSRRAWVWAAVLYALAHAPAALALRTFAGPNPLLPAAALGGGLLWGTMVRATGRLPPTILAHALFDFAVVLLFPLWKAGA